MIGTGSGAGAFSCTQSRCNQATTLTIQSALTFKADGTYTYKLNTRKAKTDKAVTNGVTIESGAQFTFTPVTNRKLPAGTVFTAISNTAATPIAGEFANLPDNYQGGDGNDLTLTVAP